MSNSIKPEDLQKELQKYLKEYKEDIQEDVKTVTDETSKEVVQELKNISPVGARKQYRKGWRAKKGKINNERYVAKVHNATDYQLTHLLEFGHATMNGGYTLAFPHVRPTEDKYRSIHLRRIEEKIKRRGK